MWTLPLANPLAPWPTKQQHPRSHSLELVLPTKQMQLGAATPITWPVGLSSPVPAIHRDPAGCSLCSVIGRPARRSVAAGTESRWNRDKRAEQKTLALQVTADTAVDRERDDGVRVGVGRQQAARTSKESAVRAAQDERSTSKA